MTVSGKSDHSGATSINAGELNLKAGATLGKGTLTVAKDAILSGVTGTTALTNSSFSFSGGATLQVGTTASATSGVFDFGGKSVTFAKSAVLNLGFNRPTTASATGGTTLQNINKLTMNATIQLHYSASFASNVAVGDSIVLWTNVTSFSGTPVLESEVIDAEKGLFWDTKDIKKGILRVTDVVPVGIKEVKNETVKSEKSDDTVIYTIDGRRVSSVTRPGLYIINGRKVMVK